MYESKFLAYAIPALQVSACSIVFVCLVLARFTACVAAALTAKTLPHELSVWASVAQQKRVAS